jgi:RNA polymerase sigma-70 factor (ECF subfamily)
MRKDSDAALVIRCKRGDRQAMSLLVSQYQRPVYNAAYRILGNTEDAADTTQTVFLKVFEHISDFDQKYKFFSWVYRIGLNEALNFKRRTMSMDEYETGVSARENYTPENSYAEGKLADEVGEAITQLSEHYRMVIVLKHYHDFSYAEMSEVLQVPEKTVRSRLFTARQRLKDILEDGMPN